MGKIVQLEATRLIKQAKVKGWRLKRIANGGWGLVKPEGGTLIRLGQRRGLSEIAAWLMYLRRGRFSRE